MTHLMCLHLSYLRRSTLDTKLEEVFFHVIILSLKFVAIH